MEAKELRIGNWVVQTEHNGSHNPYESTIQFDESNWYRIGECIEFLEDFKPIPLTEEWLLRFGFDFNEGDNGTWDNWRLTYSLKITEKHFIEISKANGNFGISETINENNNQRNLVAFNIELKYVHQLQNLIYALTGKELTQKPETNE